MSVYRMQQRIGRDPFFDAFDEADAGAVTGVRPVATTAIQALFTMNNPFVIEQADGLAVRVGMAYSTNAERLAYAYKLGYGRGPTRSEFSEAMRYLAADRQGLGDTGFARGPADRGA